MRTRLLALLALPTLVAGIGVRQGQAQQPGGNARDKATLAKQAEAFVDAFHKGDAGALAAFWTPDGDYVDQAGHHLKGREEIAKAFRTLFAENKGLKLRIDSDSLKFVTPDVALEDGTTSVIPADGGPPSRARYSIVHVKKGGEWLLSSVRDAPFVPPTNYEHLSGLEWAVGDWSGELGEGKAENLSISWSANQNFLHATFTTTVKGLAVGSADQWIGWDPVKKVVRSWIFDANGGFGEASWTRDGKKWVIKAKVVQRDGKKATATYVLGPVDSDTITLQSTDRTEDGKQLPNSKEVRLKRAK